MPEADNVFHIRGPRLPAEWDNSPRPEPAKPAPAPRPAPAPLPTFWSSTATGRPLIVNPNVCQICHKPRHPSTAHHKFDPDTAWPGIAATLGWAMPPEETLL